MRAHRGRGNAPTQPSTAWRAVLSSAAVVTALLLTACSSDPTPVADDTTSTSWAAAALLDVTALATSPGAAAQWVLVDGAANYTPTPCATTQPPAPEPDDAPDGEPATSTATWRQGTQVIQIRLVTYPDAAAARAAADQVTETLAACPSWLEGGATVETRPIELDTAPNAAGSSSDAADRAYSATHLSRVGPGGRLESAWSVTRDQDQLVSLTVAAPSSDLDSSVDELLELAQQNLTSTPSTGR